MNQDMVGVKGYLEYASGEFKELVSTDVERMQLSCSGVAEKRWLEEGGEPSAKPLERLGGSNEFERSVQLEIIRELNASWQDGLPVVMIIGDSIRMRTADGTGYGRHAYQRLLGNVNLVHVPHNCGGTRTGDQWVQDWMRVRPDIVTYNAGLHDLGLPQGDTTESRMSRSEEEYAKALEYIFGVIKEAGVRELFWCLNTPVHEERHKVVPGTSRLRGIVRYNDDIDRYNAVSRSVAREAGAEIVDLNGPLWDMGVGRGLLPDGLHLSGQGAKVLGSVVAGRVLDVV